MPLPALLLSWIVTYRYFVIFPLVIIEGPLVMLISGFLMRLGGFDLIPLYLALVAGDFIGDLFWYFLGRYGARGLVERYGRYLGVSLETVERFENAFKEHQTKVLFISKITMGFGFAGAVLISAGIARVPLRNYVVLNLVGGFIWTALLLTVGYVFGNVYYALSAGLRIVSIIVMAALALAIVYGFSRFMRERFQKTLFGV